MNLTLIGMPGVGKSFIGERLAECLKWKFIDIDRLIEEKYGKILQAIITEYGEAKFSKIEGEFISKINIDGSENRIISPGGSIIYNRKAMDFLKENSTVIYLEDNLNNILNRISNLPQRGILGLKEKGFIQLYKERTPVYVKWADFTISVTDKNLENVIKNLVNIIRK